MNLADKNTYFADVKKFMERTVIDCKKRGYVETMNGRRRYVRLTLPVF